MRGGSKRLLLIALFTSALIILVNLSWWNYYSQTSALLDSQVEQRLRATASTASLLVQAKLGTAVDHAEPELFLDLYGVLQQIRQIDSLAEIFLLDENYRYLATTSTDSESVYFLSSLHSQLIDSLFFGLNERALVTPLYRSGDIYYRSAFAPILDSRSLPVAVLGIEASVDYFDDLAKLRRRLFIASLLSIVGSLLLGGFFILLQRRINRTEQQLFLNETHAHLGRMVAVVSHELKNPLMILRGSAERIRKKTEMPEAGFVLEEVDRLNDIVSGYLDFARAGGNLLGNETVAQFDLNQLVSELKEQFQKRQSAEPVHWIETSSSQSIMFNGYARSLRQVLLNLLLNGAEACRAGGKDVRLGIALDQDENEVQLRVVDEGIGMSEDSIKRAFEPFHTTKQTGTGLGLYLTKKIVGEMGGTVQIHSIMQKGTTVTITLPRRNS